MIDSDQSAAEKNLAGVKGWLLVYAIGPAGFGILAALGEVTELWRYGGDDIEWLLGIVLLIIYSIGLYLLIAVRKQFIPALSHRAHWRYGSCAGGNRYFNKRSGRGGGTA